MKGHTESTILDFPRLTNERMTIALRILNLISFHCAGTIPKLSPLICLKIVELNMKYGISPTMPLAMAWYAAIIKFIPWVPIEEPFKYSQIALGLHDALNYNESKAQIGIICHGVVNVSFHSFSDCIEPLLSDHREGLEAGDVLSAMICAHFVCTLSFHSGQQLTNVASTLEKFSRMMREYNTNTLLGINTVYEKAVTVMSRRLRPSRQSITLKSSLSPNSTALEKEHAWTVQAMVAYLVYDYKLAWEATEQFYHNSDTVSSFNFQVSCLNVAYLRLNPHISYRIQHSSDS